MTTNLTAQRVPLRAGLYARVSSERQADEHTIASQLDALHRRAADDGLRIDAELCFVDDGYSGSTLIRPDLERLRDQAAAAALDRLYLHAPDRLARNFAYQFLLVQELQTAGVEIVFLNHPLGQSPEDDLLLQVQGVIAEYERTKIAERARRGKLYAARSGQVSVLSQAPYGYRYVRKADGGGNARFDIVLEEARILRQMFVWVGQERLSLRAVCRRLQEQGVPTRTGKRPWSSAAVAALLNNPAYKGEAQFGRTKVVARRPQLRPQRGQPAVPRRPYSVAKTAAGGISIAVPALVSAELFALVAEQLADNRRRARARRQGARYLLQGLLRCQHCGYALSGIGRQAETACGRQHYGYYRCGGRQLVGEDGTKVCAARQVRGEDVERLVWDDVCALLREPARVQQEYERRQRGEEAGVGRSGGESLAQRSAAVKRTISRLIDSYSEGLLEKAEFEPRLRGARARLERLEAEARSEADAAARQADLRLVLGKLQEFAEQLKSGLAEAEWLTRREMIRALVKEVVVGDDDIRIVYRIPPVPFVESREGDVLQDCPTDRDS